MLETVKSYIDTAKEDNNSFSLYYLNYIIRQQDLDLESEFRRLSSHPDVNINTVPMLITNAHERLVNIIDK